MKLTPVKELGNEELLNEYAGIERWAGDDFAVTPITKRYVRRGEQARAEILRRMAAKNPDQQSDTGAN